MSKKGPNLLLYCGSISFVKYVTVCSLCSSFLLHTALHFKKESEM